MQRLADAHPGRSGVVAVRDGLDAFAARALIADRAERTLDVQYYIWHADLSGTLMLAALRRAADRGVQVRLLLDDINAKELETHLAALDAHPRIEVRLFNPFRHRRWRFVDYLTDFGRINRRMHNKSFTADSAVTIVGGRNVGDEYFGAGHGTQFVDLDVLAVGPVVADVTRDFERYWSSAPARPARDLLPALSPAQAAAVTEAEARAARGAEAAEYLGAVSDSPFAHDLRGSRLAFEWTTVTMISDDPAKVLGRVEDAGLLWSRLKEMLGTPMRELRIISAYFVPGREAAGHLVELARNGVAVSVLTNALESTDVVAVHAGYAVHRLPLVQGKVALFELKRSGPAPVGRRRWRGSSRSSLHAKSFAVDRARVFIGSFNFDPRSARLNTEMGFVIDSPAMAAVLSDAFTSDIPARGYELGLSDAGALQWIERRDGKPHRHASEPGSGFWLRLGLWLMGRLPIEWLL